VNKIACAGIVIFSAILAGYVMALHQGSMNPFEFSVLQWGLAKSSFLTTITLSVLWRFLKLNSKQISATIKVSDLRIQLFIVLLAPPIFVAMTWLQDNFPRVVKGELFLNIELQHLLSYLLMAGLLGWFLMPTMLLFIPIILYLWERAYKISIKRINS
jgi:hypothetical protein